MLRATLALAAFSPLHLCFAEMPEIVDAEHTAAVLPSRTVDDQSLGSAASETVSPSAVDLRATPKEVSLNIVDHKLALSLAVDTWGQISAMEAALPSIQNEVLKRDLTVRLETQRTFLAQLETLTDGRCGTAIRQAQDEIARDAKAEAVRAVRFRPLALQKNATAMIVRIRVEILQQYADLIAQQLAARSDVEFDRHFLRNDLLHQMQMLAMLQVFAGQASADFAEVIHAAAVLAEEQLATSRQVLLQVEATPLVSQPIAAPLTGTAAAQ
jgi:hypothetical protein